MYLYDEKSNTLQTKAVRGIRIGCFKFAADRGIVGGVFSKGKGIILESAYDDDRFDKTLDKYRKSVTKNILCVPLKCEDHCYGCLELANKQGGFSSEDYDFVNAMTTELASKIRIVRDTTRNHIDKIANENLLNPLLKNILIILANILKCDKYFY